MGGQLGSMGPTLNGPVLEEKPGSHYLRTKNICTKVHVNPPSCSSDVRQSGGLTVSHRQPASITKNCVGGGWKLIKTVKNFDRKGFYPLYVAEHSSCNKFYDSTSLHQSTEKKTLFPSQLCTSSDKLHQLQPSRFSSMKANPASAESGGRFTPGDVNWGDTSARTENASDFHGARRSASNQPHLHTE